MDCFGCGRIGRSLRLHLLGWLAAAAIAAPQAVAAPAPLGSPALGKWLEGTAAEALKASEPTNDLRVGGLFALNRGLANGLDQIGRLGPSWLRSFDLDVSFRNNARNDLIGLYGLSVRRDVFASADGKRAFELGGRVMYDEVGRTGGEVSVGMRSRLRDEAFGVALRGAIDQEWLLANERYTAGASITWAPLAVSGSLYNEVRDDPSSAPAISARTVDGYEVRLDTGLPGLPWLRVGAGRAWRGAPNLNGEDVTSDQLGLQLRPFESLQIETGTSVNSGRPEPDWYTRLRYSLKLG